ncbi:Outer envelope protein 64, mitochondrial-like protein [Drosera capensis]
MRRGEEVVKREDSGAFVKRFLLPPVPQTPPPAARLRLTGLAFAVKDIFEVEGLVTGFGNLDWERTHEVARKTAVVVTSLLKNGASCVGATVLDEFSLGITGENVHHETPVNPQMPSNNPGGSSSGSAVVAAKIVDFALGTDSIGCVSIPAAYCGVLGYLPSHGAASLTGVLPNSHSLDTSVRGWFAQDPSIRNRVGHVLLGLNTLEPKRARHILFAEDLFELSKLPKQRTFDVLSGVVLSLMGIPCVCDRFVRELVTANGHLMKELIFADCLNITDSSMKDIWKNCAKLCTLDISNVPNVTDNGVGHIANGLAAVKSLTMLQRCSSKATVIVT